MRRGVLAGAASLVKQNFLRGFVFAALLVLTAAVRPREFDARSLNLVAAGALGTALPDAVVCLWATAVGIDEGGSGGNWRRSVLTPSM